MLKIIPIILLNLSFSSTYLSFSPCLLLLSFLTLLLSHVPRMVSVGFFGLLFWVLFFWVDVFWWVRVGCSGCGLILMVVFAAASGGWVHFEFWVLGMVFNCWIWVVVGVDTVFCLPSIFMQDPKKFQNIIFSPWGRENI